jgi:hypothetical protein
MRFTSQLTDINVRHVRPIRNHHGPIRQSLFRHASVTLDTQVQTAAHARLASQEHSKTTRETRVVRIVQQAPTRRQLLQISRVLVGNARRIRIRPQAARPRVRARVTWDIIQ